MQETHARTSPSPRRRSIERLAGAPISWGACEIPGWGVMPSPERVLAEMAELGLRGTELGAPGFFPDDPASIAGAARAPRARARRRVRSARAPRARCSTARSRRPRRAADLIARGRRPDVRARRGSGPRVERASGARRPGLGAACRAYARDRGLVAEYGLTRRAASARGHADRDRRAGASARSKWSRWGGAWTPGI